MTRPVLMTIKAEGAVPYGLRVEMADRLPSTEHRIFTLVIDGHHANSRVTLPVGAWFAEDTSHSDTFKAGQSLGLVELTRTGPTP